MGNRDHSVRQQSDSDYRKMIAALEAEAAEARKPAKLRTVKAPWPRFVDWVYVPRAGEGNTNSQLNPKALTPVQVEFLLADHNGQHLSYLGECPRCEGRGLLEVDGAYRNGETTIGPIPTLCIGCEDKLDAYLESQAAKSSASRESNVAKYVKAMAMNRDRICADCGEPLPVDAHASRKRHEHCAAANERERKQLSMAETRKRTEVTKIALDNP